MNQETLVLDKNDSVLIQKDELRRLYLLIREMRAEITDLTDENKKLLETIELLLLEKFIN